MDLRRWLPLIIVVIIIAIINRISAKRAKQKQDTEDFLVCIPKGFTTIFTLALIIFTYVILMVTIYDIRDGRIRPVQDYVIMFSIYFFILFFVRLSYFCALKVKGDDFRFVPVFGRPRNFTLADIGKVEQKKDGRENKIILRSKTRKKLATAYSFEQGYDLLFTRLQMEGLIGGIPKLRSDGGTNLSGRANLSVNEPQEIIDSNKDGCMKDKIIEIFKGNDDGEVSLFTDVPLSDLKYAGIGSLEQLGTDEEIILLCTDKEKLFLKAGLLLTTIHLYVKHAGERAKSSSISEIESISLRKGKHIPGIDIKRIDGKDIMFVIERAEEELEILVERLNLTIQLLKMQ